VRRCRQPLHRRGILAGDPDAIAHQLWALIHGITSLELRGMLGTPDEAATHLAAVFGAAVQGYRIPVAERGSSST
jgi:hypothetical protein